MIGQLRTCVFVFALVVSASSTGVSASHGQRPTASVDVSWGVDTTAANVAQIVRLTRDYLLRPDTSAVSRGLWSTADSIDRRWGDMIAPLAYFGLPATIQVVLSAGAGDSVYVVKVVHASTDASGKTQPMAVQRLYAVKAQHARYGWQLSNAFVRESRGWVRRTAGRMTFHYVPGQNPDPSRIARATQFVDSIARLFDVPAPERVDCIIAASPDGYLRAIGLEYLLQPAGPGATAGGQAATGQLIVYSGDPAQGEAYVHELTHVIMARYLGGLPLLGEGLPTWLGGSAGRSVHAMYRLLRQYLAANPQVTLEALLRAGADRGQLADDARRATGALFVEHVYRRSGVAGLRALKQLPNNVSELLVAMRQYLGIASDAAALDLWWRRAATDIVREVSD